MQAVLKVYCDQCEQYIGDLKIDTADMPEGLQWKLNKVILAHRWHCRYYSAVPAGEFVE